MVKFIQNLFQPASAEILAQRELEDAKRQLLAWQTAAEHADAMVVCHEARIERLTTMIASSVQPAIGSPS